MPATSSTANPSSPLLPDNSPLPLELFLHELRRLYRASYVRQMREHERRPASWRETPEEDVDYDAEEDCLYLWYADPLSTTPAGASSMGGTLTSYPDTLFRVRTAPPQVVTAWVRRRAAAHAIYDAALRRITSSSLLKQQLMQGVRYLLPRKPVLDHHRQARDHELTDEEIF